MGETKRYTTIIVLVILAIHCLGSVISATSIKGASNVDKNGIEQDGMTSISKLGIRLPICIDGDSEFTGENGVSNPFAEGTENDPYLIESWEINASTGHGIEIRNTTKHFNISNCILYGGENNYHYGIHLYNVINGKINNVTSYNNFFGISLENSSKVTISGSTIYNNSLSCGIHLKSSTNITITHCNLYNNRYGVSLASFSNSVINNCTVDSINENFYLTSSSSSVVLNTTFTKTKVHFGDTFSTLTIKYYLHVKVINSASSPITGANVRVRDNANGTFDQNYTTNSEGWMRWIVCTEYWQNQTSKVYYTPHNVSTSKEGFATNYTAPNMNQSKEITIRLEDTAKPIITNIEAKPSPQEIGGWVNITCEVVDNVAVDTVKVNITYPEGNTTNETMNKTNEAIYYYNASYSIEGGYPYYIWANDTSDNQNNSGNYSFTIQDITKPSITSVNATPELQPIEGYVNITCNVTDNIEVDEVCINITGPPDFKGINESMNRIVGTDDYYYNRSYSKGIYHFYIWANDTSNNQNESEIHKFEIDITPPEISNIQDIPDPQKKGGWVNITVNVTDNVGVSEVWLNITYPNGSYTNVSITGNLTGTTYYCNQTYNDLGQYNYTIWANDTSDNQNKSKSHFKILISLLPPTNLSIKINNETTYTNSTSVTLTIIAENASEMCFKNEDEDWSNWEVYAESKKWNLTPEDGLKTVYAKMKNEVGEAGPVNATITLDTTSPYVSVTVIPSTPDGLNGWYITNVTINLTATDNTSMVDKILYRIQSNASWGNWMLYDENITLKEDGIYYIEYNVTDIAGNKANNANNLFEVKIDKTEPDAASMSVIINGNKNYTNNLTIVLTLSANDTTSGVKNMSLSNDGINWTKKEFASSYEWNLSSGEDGIRYVYFKVTDWAGNTVLEPINDTIILDTLPPTSTHTMSPEVPDGNWTEENVTVTINGYDTSGPSGANSDVFQVAYKIGTYSASAGRWDWGTWNFESNGHEIPFADEGTYKVEYKAIDNAGNTGATGTTTVFKVDKVAPTVEIKLSPEVPNGDNGWYKTMVTVKITGVDDGSRLSVINYYNGTAWNKSTTSPVEFTINVDGTCTVKANATDNANRTSDVVNKTFKIDRIPPTGTILINENASYTNTTTVTLRLSGNDTNGVAFMCFSEDDVNYSEWKNYTMNWRYNLSGGDGTKTIYVKFKDTAGLESLPIHAIITLDTKEPILAVSEPENNKKTTESSVLIHGSTDSLNATVKINNNSVKMYDGEFWYKLNLKEGKNTIVITAEDQAGNKNSTIIIVYREKEPIKIDPYWVILTGAIIIFVAFVLYEHLKKKKSGKERTTPLEEKVAPGFSAGRGKDKERK